MLGAAAIGGGGYYVYSQGLFDGADAAAKPFTPKFEDYQGVYDAVAKKLADETDYDDGSYGPVLLRLAWHASGTSVPPSVGGLQVLMMRAVMTRHLAPEAQTAQPCGFLPRAIMPPTRG
jgi:hypothetical protein